MKRFWKRLQVLRVEEIPDGLRAEILSMVHAADIDCLVSERRRTASARACICDVR